MADLEPPAKKARLDMEATSSSGPQDLGLDAPGSPVDDLDDDFYETSVAQDMVALPQDALDRGALESKEDAPPTAATEPASAAAPIPGLGHWGEPSTQSKAQPGQDGGSEDGELSDADEENFYEVNQDAPAAEQQSVGHAVDASAAAALIPEGDEPKGLKRKASSSAQDLHALTPAGAPVPERAPTTHDEESKAEFLEAAQANKGNKDAEWELDSQASSSSSSDSSDDSSSDEDGEASDDGELLSPTEMAKRLLEGDLDDDDAGANKTTKVRTQNEVDETYAKPDIQVTDDTKITELGAVESIVDNIIVIKANTSGDYQVLEAGSALCLGDKTIIGQISETIGRVQDPRYSVGFADAAEIATMGITKETPVYFVNEHSTFVFTEPLRAQKHTDASGQYDEEAKVQEFSDDEEEAEHKRMVKAEKKQRAQAAAEEVAPPFNPPTGPSAYRERSPPNPSTYTGGGLKYSDDEDEDLGMYKPLARPDRFEDIVGAGAPVEDRSHVRRGMMRGGRGGWMDRGRGFRGRGGGGRGDMRGGAGGGHRGDRGGMAGQRGDRGGGAGGRGGGRGDRNDRGGRAFGGSPERPARQDEQQQQQQRRTPLPPQQEVRPNFRAQFSPAAGSPPRQDMGPSPRSNKKRNKKRNRRERERERKEQEREQRERERSSQPSAAANTAAYASNAAQSNGGWNSTPVAAPAPSVSYNQPAAAAPAQTPANYYVNPGVFPQQAAAAVPPPPQPQANQAQQWAQWLQMAAYFQQAQQAQGQQAQAAPPPPPPQPPQPPQPQAYPQYVQPQQQQQQQQQQPQAQYGYTYSQFQPQVPPQNPTPPADPRLQHHHTQQQQQQQPAQATPSIQDILRALGQASGR